MISKEEMRKILEEYPEYREKVFIRGYLIMDRRLEDECKQNYPFYHN